MNERSVAPDLDRLALQSAGQMATIEAELEALGQDLGRVPLWRPAAALRAELSWVRSKVARLGEAWGLKLVVAIVGPSGAGKSTLLNALAGRELSRVGYERPTTRDVVVYSATRADADELVNALGADRVQVETAPGAADLEYLMLVDTPDTNTVPENQALLAETLEHVDVVLAVFSAQNPKLQDNITFLAPFVRRLPAGAVVPVLNRVDRVALEELQGDILPDFLREIASGWGRTPERVFLVSAAVSSPAAGSPAAGSPAAGFPDDEKPLHDVNEFGELRRFLYETLNQAHQVADRRLERAEHLLDLLGEQRCQLLGQYGSAREEASRHLEILEAETQEALLAEFGTGRRASTLDLQSELYVDLARRWWGPVGWLIAIWSLLLRLGGSVSHLVAPKSAVLGASSAAGPPLAGAMSALTRLYAERWPPVGDALVAAGFEASVRGIGSQREEQVRALGGQAMARCDELTVARVRRLATGLSNGALQFALNAPTLGLLGWVAYQTLWGFYQQRFLPPDYFRHAGIALLAVWLLSFVGMQVLCSLLLRGPLRRRLAQGYAETFSEALIGPVRGQLQALEAMERGWR